MKNLKPLPKLYSERLVLRMPETSEADSIADYYLRNRQHVANSQPKMAESFYTEQFWVDRLTINRKAFQDDQACNFFVFLRDEAEGHGKQVIGSVNFTSILRRAAQFCYLGYSIDNLFQGNGYMTEAVSKGIEFMFSEMNLHRIMANYVPHNNRSAKVLRRLGFKVEGYARDYLFLNGRWQDHVMTSLTNPNWREEIS